MQKYPVEAIINPDGKSCTTLNPFGDYRLFAYKPNAKSSDDIISKNHDLWIMAESERKTYEIQNYISLLSDPPKHFFKPGTIHQARIENGKAVIL